MKKGKKKISAFLKCKNLYFDVSKKGNQMLVCEMVDVQNVIYKHYISINKKSEIWLKQLLKGSGVKKSLEDLMMDYLLPVWGDNYRAVFEHCIGKLYYCMIIENDGYRNTKVPIVGEIYSLEDPIWNKKKCEENYERRWRKEWN